MVSRTRFYEFGIFRLYPEEKLLYRGDERLDLDRKALAILEVLVENSGQLITKERLLAKVWGDVAVEAGNIGVHLSKIRKALGDDRKQGQFIETVHGEGYRFISSVALREQELYPEKQRKGRSASIAISVALVVATIAGFLWWFRLHRRGPDKDLGPITSSADARSRYELALRYESQGDDDQALATLNEAVAIDGNFLDAYVRAALVANQIGQEDQALKYLDKAKHCTGLRTEHQQLLIDALDAELTASYQDVMSKYRLLLDAYPNDVAAHYYYADYAMQSRRGFPDAQEALDRCLALSPVDPYCSFDRMTPDLCTEFELIGND